MARKAIAVLTVLIASMGVLAAAADAAAVLRLHHIRIEDATTPAPLHTAPLGVPVTVRIALENTGSSDARQVRARLESSAFNFLADVRDYGTITTGSIVTRSFTMTAARCPPVSVPVSLIVTTAQGTALRTQFRLPIACPKVQAASLARTGYDRGTAMLLGLAMLLVGIGLRARVSRFESLPVRESWGWVPAEPRCGPISTSFAAR